MVLRYAGIVQVHDSPLKVAVEHLRDQPYNPSEDHLKATTLEIVSTLKELLHLHPLYNEQLRSFAGAKRLPIDCSTFTQRLNFWAYISFAHGNFSRASANITGRWAA